MKIIFCFLISAVLLLFSCGNEIKQDEIMEIPVDIHQNSSLTLSEIAEEIKVIDLELSDECPINIHHVRRIILFENIIIVVTREKIHLFDTNGKFIHSIGSKGQGPGEYVSIWNLAFDEKRKLLFVNANPKILCYDLHGKFLKETSEIGQKGMIKDINYINNDLLVLTESMGKQDAKGVFNQSMIYRLNEEFQIKDSCHIRDKYLEKIGFFYTIFDYCILNKNSTILLYYPDLYFADSQFQKEMVLRDTLYRMANNHLIPELRLKFKNNGIDSGGKRFIHIHSIYRSSRYIFAVFENSLENSAVQNIYHYCYDTKTGEGYNMKGGYTDDINKIDKQVIIRPLNFDTEMFYYLHTNMKPDDLEEPNPTLYIGRLKK